MPGRKPIASVYPPKEYQEWQKEAAAALKGVPAFPIEGPCSAVVVCRVSKPKTTKLLTPRGDVDNYAKGILDAITKDGRFWTDDTQVQSLLVSKEWATEGPEIVVSIARNT